MNILKSLNLLVRFLLELCMLAALGYWGFKTQSGWVMKMILGIGLPILIAVIWGYFSLQERPILYMAYSTSYFH